MRLREPLACIMCGRDEHVRRLRFDPDAIADWRRAFHLDDSHQPPTLGLCEHCRAFPLPDRHAAVTVALNHALIEAMKSLGHPEEYVRNIIANKAVQRPILELVKTAHVTR